MPPSRDFADERARIRRFVRFALVGASGIVVNEGAMAVAVSGFGVNYVVGAVLATQCSTLWNCALIDFWAFKGSSHRNQRWQRWVMLIMLNNAANVATIPDPRVSHERHGDQLLDQQSGHSRAS